MGCGSGPSKLPPDNLGKAILTIANLKFDNIKININGAMLEFDCNKKFVWTYGENQRLINEYRDLEKEVEEENDRILRSKVELKAAGLVVN